MIRPRTIPRSSWASHAIRRPLRREGFRRGRTESRADRLDPEGSRVMQVEESKYLAELLEASDPEEKATELAERLTENFFVVASTYLDMAKKESQTEVIEKLERVIRIAMKAKNKTLRPEIQLLNVLLDETSRKKRSALLSESATRKTLTMNDKYFFKLLDQMMEDVGRQKDTKKSRELMEKLKSIRKDAANNVFM